MDPTPFHWIGRMLHESLAHIPLGTVRAVFVLVPIALMAWVVMLPNSKTVRPGRSSDVTGNLKMWAWLALLFQVVIYSVL